MIRLIGILLLLPFLTSCSEHEIARFTVTAMEKDFLDCPVWIELEGIPDPLPEGMNLIEEGKQEPIPFELGYGQSSPAIIFLIAGSMEKGTSRDYKLVSVNRSTELYETEQAIREEQDVLVISDDGKPVLSYRKTEKLPPQGVDSIYKRSAYIHPLYSPGGEVLTRIQPPDHYHHYGIWCAWTRTFIDGREVDYWNLAKGEGTVRSKAILQRNSGNAISGFTALHEYIDLKNPGGERVALEEFWDVEYWGKVQDGNRYIIDFTNTFRNVTDDTILFDAYRYGGGINFRAKEVWNNETATVLTSEGNDRSNADATRARWCIVEGISDVPQGRSGILFLSHPSNREHPEPMRVWPPDSNGGQLFFEFTPIRINGWEQPPYEERMLRYRMVVFDGEMSAAEAEAYWNSFAFSTKGMKISFGNKQQAVN